MDIFGYEQDAKLDYSFLPEAKNINEQILEELQEIRKLLETMSRKQNE